MDDVYMSKSEKEEYTLKIIALYDKKYGAENLYLTLYYNIVDASMSHIVNRVTSIVDCWTREETIKHCKDLLQSSMKWCSWVLPEECKEEIKLVFEEVSKMVWDEDNPSE